MYTYIYVHASGCYIFNLFSKPAWWTSEYFLSLVAYCVLGTVSDGKFMIIIHTTVVFATLSLSLSLSDMQRKQLLHLSVPSLFIAVALDEGPGPPLRSPYADLSKLYIVVGILVRSCDVTVMQKSLFEVRLNLVYISCMFMYV